MRFQPCRLKAVGMSWMEGLAVHFGEFRFGVPGFEMRWAASHAEPDDAFGFLRVVQRIDYSAGFLGDGSDERRREKGGKAKFADAAGGAAEESATGLLLGDVLAEVGVHGVTGADF